VPLPLLPLLCQPPSTAPPCLHRVRSMDEGRHILSCVARHRSRSMDEDGLFQWVPSSRSHHRRSAIDRGCDTPLDRELAQLQTVRASEPERTPASGDQDPHHVAMLIATCHHGAHAHAEGAPADAHGLPMRAPHQRARSMSQRS
jgi:hypothetical protein